MTASFDGKRYTVLVCEDYKPLREKFCQFLREEPALELVGGVSTGQAAIRIGLEKKPDIILMDIEMASQQDGLTACRVIHNSYPEAKIIVITVHSEDHIIFEAYYAGIVDYILKDASKDEILSAIFAAIRGESPIRPVIAAKIRSEFCQLMAKEKEAEKIYNLIRLLSQTESSILVMIGQGYSRRQIAERKFIELSTVKTHINNILKKFSMKKTSEVIEYLKKTGTFDILCSNFHVERGL
ncbi:MAG: response regulator transcription factor [Spirochaetota bacterium]